MKILKGIRRRFWSKVNKKCESGCWEWMGAIRNGYGCMKINKKTVDVHRLSWIIFHKNIPESLWILHRCDNHKCVNPSHLFLGTHSDNMQDMCSKGRHYFQRNPSSARKNSICKLRKNEIIQIRKLYKINKYTLKELGQIFHVSFTNVSQIVNFKTWKEIR